MIDITSMDKKDCFAISMGLCVATLHPFGKGCDDCNYFKPKGLETMVRIEEDGEIHLYTVEERRQILYGKKGRRY